MAVKKAVTFVGFAFSRADRLKSFGRTGTARSYTMVANRFLRDVGNIAIRSISRQMLDGWLERMRQEGLSPNTIDYYFRTARTLYRRAVLEQVCEPKLKPFDNLHTRPEKTAKRALTDKQLQALMSMELPPKAAQARDIFMLSLYLRGIAPVDLWKLRPCDFATGYLSYRRQKTGKRLEMKVEPEAMSIVRRYSPARGGDRLLLQSRDMTNRYLGEIGTKLRLPFRLTLYCARHTWASKAMRLNCPLSLISKGMGHTNEETTRIYLSEIATAEVDKMNRTVITAISKLAK